MIQIRSMVLCGALCACTLAGSAQAAGAAQNSFAIGLTAVSGMSDLENRIEANNPRLSAVTISPVGLSAAYTYRFGDGWGISASVGPIVAARGAASFVITPLALAARYDLANSESFSPYVRLGVEKALVSGDLLESGGTGGVFAVGGHFGPPDRTSWGLELAARTLKVNVRGTTTAATKSAQPYKASLTAFWSF